jgi:hypothetical protein
MPSAALFVSRRPPLLGYMRGVLTGMGYINHAWRSSPHAQTDGVSNRHSGTKKTPGLLSRGFQQKMMPCYAAPASVAAAAPLCSRINCANRSAISA